MLEKLFPGKYTYTRTFIITNIQGQTSNRPLENYCHVIALLIYKYALSQFWHKRFLFIEALVGIIIIKIFFLCGSVIEVHAVLFIYQNVPITSAWYYNSDF